MPHDFVWSRIVLAAAQVSEKPTSSARRSLALPISRYAFLQFRHAEQTLGASTNSNTL
jgi:hypothetical protein